MLLAKKIKDPTDRKRYVVDYFDWLDVAEQISAFTATPDDGAVVTDTIAISADGKSVSFYVEGGASGQSYNIATQMTSTATQVKNDHIELVVELG